MYKKCKSCCQNILTVTSIIDNGSGALTFTTDSTATLKNGCTYIIKAPCSLLPKQATTTINQLFVSVNNIAIPLECKLGNYVFSDQIKCFYVNECNNIILRVIYGSTPTHLKIVSQDLCISTAYNS